MAAPPRLSSRGPSPFPTFGDWGFALARRTDTAPRAPSNNTLQPTNLKPVLRNN
jgi:hypothetical protein